MPPDDGRGNWTPPDARRRGPVTSRVLAKGDGLHQANFTRTIFDSQPLAEFAGFAVLAWYEDVAKDGTMLGVALVRLPNVADIDLVVEFHCSRSGGRFWTEAAADTPRRCRRRLEKALSTLSPLVARAIGRDAIERMLRERNQGGGA